MNIKKFLITTLILLFSFSFLILLVNIIDFKNVKENIIISSNNYDIYETTSFFNNKDNCTDPVMLNIMYYDSNQTLLEKSFLNRYGYIYEKNSQYMTWNQLLNLESVINNYNESVSDYGRHWNGWQIVFKPLLNFFNYDTILKIFFVFGIILLLMISYLIIKKINFKFFLVFLISFLAIRGWSFASSFQYLTIWIPTLISIIVVLKLMNNKKFSSELFFYILGSIVTFFNFLNFTLISFIFPIIILMVNRFYNGETDYKNNTKYIIKNLIFWSLGYFGLWICKWVIGTIFFGSNFINEALLSTNQRLGSSDFNYLDVLYLNINEFFKFKINIIITILVLLLIVLEFRKNTFEKLKISFPFLLICILPFAWFMIFKNHSAIHFWMTYHLLSPILFCFMFLILFFKEKRFSNIKSEKLSLNEYFFLIIALLFFLFNNFLILYLAVLLFILFNKKSNKELKFCTFLLSIYCIGMLSISFFSKNFLSNNQHFQNMYSDLYDKTVKYATLYLNDVKKDTKVALRNLVTNYDRDSVFLLQCNGYVIFNEQSIKPFIKCGDISIDENIN